MMISHPNGKFIIGEPSEVLNTEVAYEGCGVKLLQVEVIAEGVVLAEFVTDTEFRYFEYNYGRGR